MSATDTRSQDAPATTTPKPELPSKIPDGADSEHPLADALYPEAPKPTDKSGKTGEEKPAAETPKAEDKPGWDKDRQVSDQLRASNQMLQQRIAELGEQVAAIQKAKADETSAAAEAERTKATEAVDAIVGSLSDESNAEQVTDAIKAVKSLIEVSGSDAQVTALEAQVAELKEMIASGSSATDDVPGTEDQWAPFLTDMDKQYGDQHRAAALEAASEYFAGKGYTQEEPPDDEAGLARVELEYSRLAGSKSAAAPREDAPVLDDGAGGGVAAEAGGGTVDEVAAQMKREGKFDNVVMPTM